MRTDEEVRQEAAAHASRRPIAAESLAGQEERRPQRGRQHDAGIDEHCVEILDAVVVDGGLGIYHVVDQHWASQGRLLQPCERPVRPDGIVGDEIEQDVGVDQDQVSDRPASGP